MIEIKRELLLMEPCALCRHSGHGKNGCTENSYRRCGVYAEIVCAQWDETCRLIRERAKKK